VYHWEGRFAVCSLDFGNSGPFDTLDEALDEQGLLAITSATTSVTCSSISAKELAKRLSQPPGSSSGRAARNSGQTSERPGQAEAPAYCRNLRSISS
jgi:hypothetical protein